MTKERVEIKPVREVPTIKFGENLVFRKVRFSDMQFCLEGIGEGSVDVTPEEYADGEGDFKILKKISKGKFVTEAIALRPSDFTPTITYDDPKNTGDIKCIVEIGNNYRIEAENAEAGNDNAGYACFILWNGEGLVNDHLVIVDPTEKFDKISIRFEKMTPKE